MRRTLAATVVAVSIALLAPPASAGGQTHIAIGDLFFSPATKGLPVTATLSFSWDNGGGFNHTATSNVNGFIDTGTIMPGASGLDALFGAGTYRYHCSFHPTQMKGTIKVRPTASATAIGVGEPVTITFGVAIQKGNTFDLERRRDGGAWVVMRSKVAESNATFTPSRTGTYDFRARTYNTLGKASAYSPMRTVTVA